MCCESKQNKSKRFRQIYHVEANSIEKIMNSASFEGSRNFITTIKNKKIKEEDLGIMYDLREAILGALVLLVLVFDLVTFTAAHFYCINHKDLRSQKNLCK